MKKIAENKYVVFYLIIIIFSWLSFIDNYGIEQTTQFLKQSAISFGVARGLNAAISVLQSTTLSFSFFGGVSIGVGEILDPLNDLIESFSWIAVASMSSIGIQKIFINITSSLFFKVFITICGSCLMLNCYKPYLMKFESGFKKIFIILIALRFVIPTIVILSTVVEKSFITETRVTATNQLMESSTYMQSFDIDSIKEKLKPNSANLSDNKLEYESDKATTSMIDLFVVFIIQAFILPLIFLLLVYKTTQVFILRRL